VTARINGAAPNARWLLSQATARLSTKRNHAIGFWPNAGTIVNTAPRLSRNTLVSVDDDPPAKLKRSRRARQPLPFTYINKAARHAS
jgi:hypothetical protein